MRNQLLNIASRTRREEGVALVAAIIILFILLAIGTALIATATGQQRSGYNQQKSESAYSLAEAALNAQIYQLSLQWPTATDAPSGSVSNYPASCTSASNGTSYCPSSSDLSSYSTGSGTCPTGTQGDAWSSSSTVGNGWTTYVRDAGPSTSQSQQDFFQSTLEKNTYAYDYGNSGTPNGFVWVRAAATVNCHTAVVVQRVSEQITSLNFPSRVLSANNFAIENNGNKNLLGTKAADGQTSSIYLRCLDLGGSSSTPAGSSITPSSDCANYLSGGGNDQITPTVNFVEGSNPTLSSSQVQELELRAAALGTCYGGSLCTNSTNPSCPTTIPSGSVVYVQGSSLCTLNIGGLGGSTTTLNSSSSPGILIVNQGDLSFQAGTFYGAIYMMNAQQCTPGGVLTQPCFQYKVNNSWDYSYVISLRGSATITGGIDVDNEGGVLIGENNGNLTFGDIQLGALTTFGGAAGTPNTFRQLPLTQ